MNINKILIAFLLLILAVGAVSAADNITDDSPSVDDSTVEFNTSDEKDLTMDIKVEENIEILPTKNQRINIGNIEHTTGNFSLSIDGEKQNITFDTEYLPPDYYGARMYLKFDASNLSYGEHRYDLNFTGDEYFNQTTKSGILTVTPIILDVASEYYLLSTYENSRENLEDRVFIQIHYLKNITGTAYLYMNGAEKKINLSDFKAKGDMGSEYDGYSCDMYSYYKYKLITLDKDKDCYDYGEYLFFDKPTNFTLKYKNITKSAFLNVTYDVNINKEIKKGTNLEIFIPKGISKNVKVKIDGKSYKLYSKRIDADYYRLQFYVKTGSLNYGKHTIKISTPTYTLSKTFRVVDEPVSPKTVYAYYGEGKTVTLTVYGEGRKVIATGANVYLKIDQKGYNYAYYFDKQAKKNGKVSIKIPTSLKPGTHTITVETYESDFWDIPGKVKLVIKHVVTLKSVKVKKSAKKLVLTATLKNKKVIKNKQVTFKFNGKTYKAKTNSKGIAKITIKSSILKKLKVGKKVTYQATYLKDTVKKTVKVQR